MFKNLAPNPVEVEAMGKMSALTSVELDALAKEIPLIKTWIAAIEAEIEARITAGESFGYAQMRDKLATRKWMDGVDIGGILSLYMDPEIAAPRVPLSPTKVEKIIGKKKMEDLAVYVQKVSSGKVLGFVNPDKSIFKTEN